MVSAAEQAGEVDRSKRPMRVLVAHNVPGSRTGGMSRTMAFIHDHIEGPNVSVEYLCAEDLPADQKGRRERFTFPLLVLRRAREAARRGTPYDIINVHEPSSAAIAALRHTAGDPAVVVTSYGVERRGWELSLEELRLGRGGPTLKTRILYPLTSLWQSRLGLRRADHVLCKNFQDRDFLVDRLDIPAEKITRFYPGADPLYAEVAGERDYRRAKRLLFAGTWIQRKGIDDLIPAFVELAGRYPDLELVVIGGGVPDHVVRESFPAELRARVSCVQAKDDHEAAAVFAAADIYLLPSLFEGTPLTLMEAMMSGLPVVTTDTAGMRDVIEHGRNGLLIPIRSPGAIEERVETLIRNVDLRAKLGCAAREDAQRLYTWDRVAVQVRDVYTRLRGPGSQQGR